MNAKKGLSLLILKFFILIFIFLGSIPYVLPLTTSVATTGVLVSVFGIRAVVINHPGSGSLIKISTILLLILGLLRYDGY